MLKTFDFVIPMYNLAEYSDNYSKTSGSLLQYCKDMPAVDNNNAFVNFAENNLTDSFNFNAKIARQTGNNGTKTVDIMTLLKYLSNICRTLEMPLLNYEINLVLTWSTNCVIVSTNISNQNATFEITNTRLYLPVVTLSTNNNSKLHQQVKSGFKRIISWDKYLKLFTLAFENDAKRASAKCYYIPNVELKDYNIVINGETFLIIQ